MRYLILLTATLFLMAGNGRFSFAASAWLGPVLLLHFLRGSTSWRDWLAGYAAIVAGFWVAFLGVIPLPPFWYGVVVAGSGAALLLPYAVDQWLHQRPTPLLATLPFPATLVAVEYLMATLSPYGSWGSTAYTQYGNLALLQIAALTGPYGVTFFVAWFAPVASHAWTHRSEWPKSKSVLIPYAAVLAAVLVFGYLRLAANPLSAQDEIVRIAAVSAPVGDARDLFRAMYETLDPAELESARAAATTLHDDLLAMSRREARAGAKIVFWAECNGIVAKADEATLIERGRALARDEKIYLLMALATIAPGEGAYENVVYTIDPGGEIANVYHKARPVPGDDEKLADKEIAIVDTPHGRMAVAICFDMDFLSTIRRAGKERADFIIAPSKDWPEINPLHTHMAMLRGIENGCAVVRGVYDGLSMAGDAFGRTLSAVEVGADEHGTLVVEVPARGVLTLYGAAGDWFARLCSAATIGFIAIGLHRRNAQLSA